MILSFKEFLKEEETKAAAADIRLSMLEFEKLLRVFAAASTATNKMSQNDPIGDRNVIGVLEMIDLIDLFKEHLVEWLHTFDWKAGKTMYHSDKKEGHIDFWNYVESEFDHILETYYKRAHPKADVSIVNKMARLFNNIIIKPIVSHYKAVGNPQEVLDSIDVNDFSSKANDVFGDIIHTIEKMEVTGHHADDIIAARKTLMTYDRAIKQRLRGTRKISKRQRLELIRRAAEKVQGTNM